MLEAAVGEEAAGEGAASEVGVGALLVTGFAFWLDLHLNVCYYIARAQNNG